jgi:hypothetical protein
MIKIIEVLQNRSSVRYTNSSRILIYTELVTYTKTTSTQIIPLIIGKLVINCIYYRDGVI